MVPCRPRLARLNRAYVGDDRNQQIERLSDGAPARLCGAEIQASPLSADRSRSKPGHLRPELHGDVKRRAGIFDRGYAAGLMVTIPAQRPGGAPMTGHRKPRGDSEVRRLAIANFL